MKFHVMDLTGHSTIDFTKDEAGVAEAMEKFKMLVDDQKKIAAVKGKNGDVTKVKSFDPNAEETVFISPLVGG